MWNYLFDVGGASAEEARAIREAVANASTLEEVERLNQMLRAGVVPGKATQASSKNGNGKVTSSLTWVFVLWNVWIVVIGEDMEEEEDEPMENWQCHYG